ncbi:LOW QUALITY PROTEIN: hypothetical protein ACHAXA_004086 [Cyclostephanos tholiformis]|uniref:GmrSD restriction endonucleases C-terminal domain-containing protein n=1 Tax=Cyclostephanos tholiformis TaxID=382380 RepID=A0ABD3RII0_9STRA
MIMRAVAIIPILGTVLPAAAAFVAIVPNLATSFAPNTAGFVAGPESSPSSSRAAPSSLLLSSPSSSDGSSPPRSSLPFFAASPMLRQQQQQQQQPQTAATVTLRLPLGTIFDGRDYIFVTESNVRSYEWTTREADLLMDDLIDAASLGGGGGRGGGGGGSGPTGLGLRAVPDIPTSDWDPNVYGLGNRYDVYDGQQRLVTLNLLLAGLRDSFRREADGLSSSRLAGGGGGGGGGDGKGGKRAVALAATAHEISGMLMPTKVRKSEVLRITLRRRDNVILERILMGGGGGDDDDDDSTTPDKYPQMSKEGRAALLSTLSPANSRILHNFVHLSNRLTSLTTRERLRLLDYVVERVHLLVCIPETSRIARNIVLSQQGRRRGMDNEPIDDFKGLVCFRYTLDEDDMYRTFDSWDALASEPVMSTGGTTRDDSAPAAIVGAIGSVGRDVLSSACLLRASASLRTKIRSSRDRGGGDEVYEWERWLRRQLYMRNDVSHNEVRQSDDDSAEQQQRQQLPSWQGKDFFVEEIAPASIALYKFRTGLWDGFVFLSKTTTRKQRDTTIARLNFLRDIALGVTSAKEAEIVILELLLRVEHGDDSSLSRYLDDILPLIEKTALWMALMRPSSMQRHARVFALLDSMDDFDSVGGLGMAKAMGDNERVVSSLREAMNLYEFGASIGGKRLAGAILKRMNAHLMIEEKKNVPDGGSDAAVVDVIEPNWTSEEGERVANRIGNLALVSSSALPAPRNRRAKKSSGSLWESKVKRYKKEPWILTRQVAEFDQWNVDAVHDQQGDVLSLMDLVWS